MRNNVVSFILIIFFWSCSSAPRYARSSTNHKSKKTVKVTPKKAKTKRHPKFIDPKTVNTNVKHKKRMVGTSSFYAEDFHGKLTANGEIYDMYGLTAAHKTLPLNTVARVTNLDNGKSLILRINDRGPYIEGRMLDLSLIHI